LRLGNETHAAQPRKICRQEVRWTAA